MKIYYNILYRALLSGAVIAAAEFPNAKPTTIADALDDVTASPGEVSANTSDAVVGFVAGAVSSALAPAAPGGAAAAAPLGITEVRVAVQARPRLESTQHTRFHQSFDCEKGYNNSASST